MTIFFSIFIFIASLCCLIKASDFFIEGAENAGLYFGLSPFITGVLIVGAGTSLPEMVSSTLAVLNNHSEIVIGNVLGSNITNIFFVLGLSAVIGKKFNVTYNLMRVDIPFLTGTSFILIFMILDGTFTIGDAILSLMVLVIYFWSSLSLGKDEERGEKKEFELKPWLYIFISPIFIFIGAKYTIDSVIKFSELVNISTEVIALSAVALGTSLPEAFVSVSAVRKGNPEIAVGNVIGSNIFNAAGVMGVSGLAGKVIIPQSITSFSVPVFLGATFMYIIIAVDKEINKFEGAMLLILYMFFLGRIFGLL